MDIEKRNKIHNWLRTISVWAMLIIVIYMLIYIKQYHNSCEDCIKDGVCYRNPVFTIPQAVNEDDIVYSSPKESSNQLILLK